ncbi:T9SS type A sorting domain-containing protein [uncultured Dokdonia sp.]|uniref:T9SS type A sorting domain-containing protein n=1 Tax=uncultured Dokdonia sp. TaxID=575653 RepID=UPI0030EDAD2E|tara:strand:+ start:59503 stop:62103 length:2601 start_codon:yes stop_codon:yes gene_type:complete
MIANFYSLTRQIIALSCLLYSFTASAQDVPFNCDFSAYLFQYNDVYSIDLASGNSFLAAKDITPGNINAAAYNPADGYIWGYLSSPSKSIVRIDQNFETTTITIDALPTGNKYVGDINVDGQYYFKAGGSTYYTVDLDPASETYTELTSTASLSQGLSIHDWAFNAVDNQLYAVEKGTNILYRINPENGQVQTLGIVPILSGLDYTYGAVYFDASGRFYVSANQTGTIYVIQSVQDLDGIGVIDSNLFAFGPSSNSNDGARCPTAPVLQEICDNGIDDDGDGLIDCEDPSCSGYGMCATIDPEASTGNKGGLESNNRLSNAIAKRNFNRAKESYEFNKDLAPLVDKKETYAVRTAQAFTLADLIPLEEIDEDYVVESTPTDLVAITNATDVYAVDYIKGELSTASILALKTENGVYEHTKYICDRLLGAELISVSTIAINDQQFIKSLIKNIDGSVEFVLSLSAKMVNNETEFAVESHWNLDSYEDDVTFYNFQIWANSIDDLHKLGQQVLNLLEVQKPVTSYNTSTPPTVFVKKGNYNNGALQLEIINTNATESVTFDAGIRATETSEIVTTTSSISLGENYITQVTIDTGYLFDIGFRIGDGINTPDDLFLSDGPWGVDASQEGTDVISYEISENEQTYGDDTYAIERNLSLTATTNSYVAAYRALTARFQAVDVSMFNALQMTAKGTGNLEITFVKESIEIWEDQYKATIALTDNYQDFDISFENFTSPSGAPLLLNDLVTVVFTMVSQDGTMVTKEMDVNDIQFANSEVLSTEENIMVADALINYPNPFISQTTIRLPQASATVQITVVDMLGRIVDAQEITTNNGGLTAAYNAPNLQTGIYTYKIIDSASQQHSGKFVIKR